MFYDYIFDSNRWRWFKDNWANAKTIVQKANALVSLFNGWPDITYPWREVAKDGTLLPRGEASYNRLLEIAVEKWGNYNDLRNWKNVLWREFAHLQQGCLWFPLHYLAYYVTELCFPGYGFVGFLMAWEVLIISDFQKEFIEDVQGDGRMNYKNYIDFVVRLIPGLIFLSSWFW